MPDIELEDVARKLCGERSYQLIKEHGEGTFKKTFDVRDGGGRSLALKVCKPGGSAQRALREVMALERCDHPSIAVLHEVGTTDLSQKSFLFMIEEFLGGGTLGAQLDAGGPLTRQEARRIGASLIGAVEHIADLDLVHRDIKPENIMFRPGDLTPVLVDFGLVRDLAKESLTQTWQMQGPGTPMFAPPEQLLNNKNMIDWRSDQFSLGVTISIALLGFHPYSEVGDDAGDIVDRVAGMQSPRQRFRDAARGIDMEVLAKMVQPYPIGRFRTVGQLIAAWAK